MPEVSITTPRGLRLAGTFETPTAAAPTPAGAATKAPAGSAVLFAHGFLADRTSLGRMERFAELYRAHGFATLAFDFSGCGDSDDDVVLVEHEIEDLRAASDHLASLGYPRQVVHAHSLGSLVALRTHSPHVEAMVLTGAIAGPIVHPWEHVLSEEQLDEIERTGSTTVVDDGPSSREVNVISEQTLADFAAVDQSSLLGAVTCPVLLVHGGALIDGEEHPLLTRSRLGLAQLPAGSALEVVAGGGHALFDRTDEVSQRALAWLDRRLA
ncbi:MAG: alpha/beta fold hydrolase [Cellulomonadaceae bacterium]|nr:alpha/beta fold hydrolase [Cellulomonadaceae bacterium]